LDLFFYGPRVPTDLRVRPERQRVFREGGRVVESNIEVGDWVRVRSDGSSPAAKKYAGKQGQATMVGPGFDGTIVDVQLAGNGFDTVFEERDLSGTER
jgi:hypothetical protein